MFPVSDVIPSRTRPVVTIGLIALSAAVFVYALQLDRQEMFAFARTFGVVPAELVWPTLLSATFIHDGWIHFGGNMLYLWIFGDNVEDVMGHGWYLLFYLAAGSVAAAAHLLLHPASGAPLVGASGAVAAVMGAYFVLYPRSQVLTAIFLLVYLDVVEIPAIVFLGVWFVVQVLGGMVSMGAGAAAPHIAFAAHLAGFASGIATGLLLRRRRRPWGDPLGS